MAPTLCAEFLPELTAAVLDPHIQPKEDILVAISRVGNAKAADVLAEMADKPERFSSGVAFGLLEKMGPVAEPAFIRLLANGTSGRVRVISAATLWRMRAWGAGARDAFRNALHDPDENVRIPAALGLAQLGDHAGVNQLQAAADEHDGRYEFLALVELANLGQPDALATLKKAMTGEDKGRREGAAAAIAFRGSPQLKELSYSLGLLGDPRARMALAEKLLDPDSPKDRAVLVDMLRNGDELSQVIAAERLLGTSFRSEAERAIGRGLISDEPVRSSALRACLSHAELRSVLADAIVSHDPWVQTQAINAIVELGQRYRFADVRELLSSDVPYVSAAAARALVSLDPEAARSVLENGLASPRSYVRIHSAAMLVSLVDGRSDSTVTECYITTKYGLWRLVRNIRATRFGRRASKRA